MIEITNTYGYVIKVNIGIERETPIDENTTISYYVVDGSAASEPDVSDSVSYGNDVYTINGVTYTDSGFDEDDNYKTITSAMFTSGKSYVVVVIKKTETTDNGTTTTNYEVVESESIASVTGTGSYGLIANAVLSTGNLVTGSCPALGADDTFDVALVRTIDGTSTTSGSVGTELPSGTKTVGTVSITSESQQLSFSDSAIKTDGGTGDYAHYYLIAKAGNGPTVVLAVATSPRLEVIPFINPADQLTDLFVAGDADSLISSQNSASAIGIASEPLTDGTSIPSYIKIFVVGSDTEFNANFGDALETALGNGVNAVYQELANADISGVSGALGDGNMEPKITGSLKLSFVEKAE